MVSHEVPPATMVGFLLPMKITWVFGGSFISVAKFQKQAGGSGFCCGADNTTPMLSSVPPCAADSLGVMGIMTMVVGIVRLEVPSFSLLHFVHRAKGSASLCCGIFQRCYTYAHLFSLLAL